MWNNKRGLTLIELLVAISLSTIIGSAVAMIFDASMEAWRFGDEMASIEAVLPPLVNILSEGDYTHPGLVDALVLTYADPDRVEFVPLILDYFTADTFLYEDQIFPLSKPYLPGSPLPKGQIRLTEDTSFQNVPVVLLRGAEQTPSVEGDAVRFLGEIPNDAEVRVIYRPDHGRDASAVMAFEWNADRRQLTREYLGEKVTLSENSFGVEITNASFRFFTNANTEAPYKTGEGVLGNESRDATTAVLIHIDAKKGETKKTARQFINMRNLGWASTGVVIGEGSEVKIPDSLLVKALSVVNISGITESGTLELEAESDDGQTWVVKLNFGLVEKEPVLLDYTVEYPAGLTVLERSVFQPIAQGIDLLSLDSEGRYDYDHDTGVDDEILFDENPVLLRVKSMNIGGAALYVRP